MFYSSWSTCLDLPATPRCTPLFPNFQRNWKTIDNRKKKPGLCIMQSSNGDFVATFVVFNNFIHSSWSRFLWVTRVTTIYFRQSLFFAELYKFGLVLQVERVSSKGDHVCCCQASDWSNVTYLTLSLVEIAKSSTSS